MAKVILDKEFINISKDNFYKTYDKGTMLGILNGLSNVDKDMLSFAIENIDMLDKLTIIPVESVTEDGNNLMLGTVLIGKDEVVALKDNKNYYIISDDCMY